MPPILCPPAEEVIAAMAESVEVGIVIDMDMAIVEDTEDISILLFNVDFDYKGPRRRRRRR